MIDCFSDQSAMRHGLDFEAALARAQAAEGLISAEAADAIAMACEQLDIEPDVLAEDAAVAGTLAIPLVASLHSVLSGEAAGALHRGATSQDLADTILMCQCREASTELLGHCARITTALFDLAEKYAATPAVGRTLLQDAMPVGFGLRLAQAAAGIENGARRLAGEIAANAKVQLGGAVGTRAGLDGKGAAIASRIAADLGLATGVPWHARRVGVAGIATALGILAGALGKFARDVSLLAQNNIGEMQEPRIAGRGDSSAMAHKRNPTGCQVALSASIRAPGLVASILSGLTQEEERGLGGWQAEAPALADLFLVTGGSAAALAVVAEGLDIGEAAIAHNLAMAGLGDDIGESAEIVSAILTHHRRS